MHFLIIWFFAKNRVVSGQFLPNPYNSIANELLMKSFVWLLLTYPCWLDFGPNISFFWWRFDKYVCGHDYIAWVSVTLISTLSGLISSCLIASLIWLNYNLGILCSIITNHSNIIYNELFTNTKIYGAKEISHTENQPLFLS